MAQSTRGSHPLPPSSIGATVISSSRSGRSPPCVPCIRFNVSRSANSLFSLFSLGDLSASDEVCWLNRDESCTSSTSPMVVMRASFCQIGKLNTAIHIPHSRGHVKDEHVIDEHAA